MTQPTATDLQTWTGRSQTLHDTAHPTPVVALAAMLDHPLAPARPGNPLPPLWHWLYSLPMQRQSDSGPDGPARRDGVMPPVPLPRRRWAGRQFDFCNRVQVGGAVARASTIDKVTPRRHGIA